MLKMHQRLALLDHETIPLIATVATSFGAGGRDTSSSARWAHLALGSATGDLYFTAAYFAIFAPRIPGTQTRGQVRVHKAMRLDSWPGHDPDSDPRGRWPSIRKTKAKKYTASPRSMGRGCRNRGRVRSGTYFRMVHP